MANAMIKLPIILLIGVYFVSIAKLSLSATLDIDKISNNTNETCPDSLSVVLESHNLEYLPNGSFLHQTTQEVYPQEFLRKNNDTTYGCVCKEGFGNKTCIRKCCQGNEFLKVLNYDDKSECTEIENEFLKVPDLLPAKNQLENKLENISGLSQKFRVIVNQICPFGRYRLEPERFEDDNFVIFLNGTLKTGDLSLTQSQYCLDWDHDFKTIIVLVCHSPELVVEEENPMVTIVHPIGVIISIPFLVATLFVYAVIPELRNLYGITLMCYVGCLLGAYIFLVTGRLIYHRHFCCVIIAFVIHFSFLASFFWLNVMCFDIWWTFGKNPGLYTNPYGGFRALQGSQKKQEKKKFACYSIYAWGCAGILTGICLIMDFHPNISSSVIRPQFGKESCWFATDAARAIYFYGPMGVTVVCNIILFITTAMKIVHHKKETAHLNRDDNRRHNDNKQWFNLYLKLFIVMGVNWSMEIASWICGNKPDYLWYITDIANTLQGLVIFIIFVWKRKIKILLLKRFGCKDSKFLQSRNSTRSTHNSSMSTKTNTSILNPLQDKFKMTSIERNPDEHTEAF
ncbi:G-protein coupled receptor Mth2 isoform X1 [Cotesia typhae]|uniref:G-protein coupled receptor Mth2 isoform X1 n=1 Tax=Cotesia typhae TaxID=2053667 RepID=UPI003D69738C